MTLLFKIVYAAHANGTHHKLALDALSTLENENAERWRRLFLKHVALYLQGSKAPDTEFKDFKNHVLHVGDNYWGGAPEKAESWYRLLVRSLADENWSEAVWCAGILSHYYTDPIQPLHTAQTEAENNIHRACEWSISKSYGALRKRGLARPLPLPDLGRDEHWIKDAVIAGAETSNIHYETLIARYDFHRGVVEPEEGLDEVCRTFIGQLLVYAAAGFGRILDRAIMEAGVAPPDVALTAQTVLAGLEIPVKWVTRKISDAADRRLVEQMYDELQATGRVEKTLSEDDRCVKVLYDKEVAPLRNDRRMRDRMRRRESTPQPHGALPVVRTGHILRSPLQLVSAASGPGGPAANEAGTSAQPPSLQSQLASVTSVPQISPKPSLTAAAPEHASTSASRTPAERYFLTEDDDVEAAPSVGPRTAERLAAVGIVTVKDLLSANPANTAEKLDVRHITPDTITDWQDQSRLVIEIPELRGTHAQLLVGAGLRTCRDVAEADPATTQAAILRFVGTREGQRILRDGTPPDLEKITDWLARARAAVAA
jgi:predicted flap endonuclease-1-like 5' DNA nuclease